MEYWIIEEQTIIIDNVAISKNQRLIQTGQKIMDVFVWEYTMTDDMMVKRYSIPIQGEWDMILK